MVIMRRLDALVTPMLLSVSLLVATVTSIPGAAAAGAMVSVQQQQQQRRGIVHADASSSSSSTWSTLQQATHTSATTLEDFLYTHDAPFEWHESYTHCGEQLAEERQSPIDIHRSEQHAGNGVGVVYHYVASNASDPHAVQIVNEGHALEVRFKDSFYAPRQTIDVTLSNTTGALPVSFLLDHIKVRLARAYTSPEVTGSEHLIKGERFALELQFMHWDTAKARNFENATYVHGAALGLSVMVAETATAAGVSTALTDLANMVRFALAKGETADMTNFDVRSLLPSDAGSRFYWYAEGSLTQPPCTEGVTWIVLANHEEIHISTAQLNLLRYVSRDASLTEFMASNYRPVQPSNGRSIYCSWSGCTFHQDETHQVGEREEAQEEEHEEHEDLGFLTQSQTTPILVVVAAFFMLVALCLAARHGEEHGKSDSHGATDALSRTESKVTQQQKKSDDVAYAVAHVQHLRNSMTHSALNRVATTLDEGRTKCLRQRHVSSH